MQFEQYCKKNEKLQQFIAYMRQAQKPYGLNNATAWEVQNGPMLSTSLPWKKKKKKTETKNTHYLNYSDS